TRIDPAVEVDDFAVVGLAHPHIMHVADRAALRGKLSQGNLDRLHSLGWGLTAAGVLRLQRFDMGFYLDGGSAELVLDGSFQSVGLLVRRAERHLAVDFKIEGDREAIL